VALSNTRHAHALGDQLHAALGRATSGVDLALQDVQGFCLLDHRLRLDATPQPKGVIVAGVHGTKSRACQQQQAQPQRLHQ
jgi:hypothetical protein